LAEQLTWSPNGSKIAFYWAKEGNPDIWVLDIASGELQRLTDDPAADVEPAWSPDGAFLVFTSERDGNSEIYVMRADGTEVVRLTDSSTHDNSPTWIMGK
jgi:TolB protein